MEGMAPILHVADARASIAWYAQLGFEVESEHTFGPDWPFVCAAETRPGAVAPVRASPRRRPACDAKRRSGMVEA